MGQSHYSVICKDGYMHASPLHPGPLRRKSKWEAAKRAGIQWDKFPQEYYRLPTKTVDIPTP